MMNLTKSIVTAALAVATLGVLPATAAEAQTSVSISYRDGYRGDYRGYDRRDYRRDYRRYNSGYGYRDRDRDGVPNRWDRYDNRRNWNGYRSRCHTELRYDRWSDRRVRVRVCR